MTASTTAHKAELYSLERFVEEGWQFHIPMYQRLFVWESDQVKTLLEDLVNACTSEEESYYLGGIILMERPSPSDSTGTPSGIKQFDVIDGQQRLTMLWLMSSAWADASPLRPGLSEFLELQDTVGGTEPRLKFEIRDDDAEYFKLLIKTDKGHAPSQQEKFDEGHPFGRLEDALALLKPERKEGASSEAAVTFVGTGEQLRCSVDRLADFLFRNVKFVATVVPPETDLNKLFEVINNRGAQLLHHELLKAQLLDKLSTGPRTANAARALLWDACANMESFIEQSVHETAGRYRNGGKSIAYGEIATLFSENKGHLRARHDSLEVVERWLEQSSSSSGMSDGHQGSDLESIIASAIEVNINPTQVESAEADELSQHTDQGTVRSIVGFPLFLLHVLRIWLYRHGEPDVSSLRDGNLLELFQSHLLKHRGAAADSQDVARRVECFLSLLFEARVAFDAHIIKWVQGHGPHDETHQIRDLYMDKENSSFRRTFHASGANRDFTLLQSMLYHSQDVTAQHWLTPLLAYLLEAGNPKAISDHTWYLKRLDNFIHGPSRSTRTSAGLSLGERSRAYMEDPWSQVRHADYREELSMALGTSFAHYWFYKSEFVLWTLREEVLGQLQSHPKWQERFRITSKNSVEHIAPRNPEDTVQRKVTSSYLDCFGNLGLVTRSRNSSMGNKDFEDKSRLFKKYNGEEIDSLKLALVYLLNDQWDDSAVEQHQEEMFSYFDEYFRQVDEQATWHENPHGRYCSTCGHPESGNNNAEPGASDAE